MINSIYVFVSYWFVYLLRSMLDIYLLTVILASTMFDFL